MMNTTETREPTVTGRDMSAAQALRDDIQRTLLLKYPGWRTEPDGYQWSWSGGYVPKEVLQYVTPATAKAEVVWLCVKHGLGTEMAAKWAVTVWMEWSHTLGIRIDFHRLNSRHQDGIEIDWKIDLRSP